MALRAWNQDFFEVTTVIDHDNWWPATNTIGPKIDERPGMSFHFDGLTHLPFD